MATILGEANLNTSFATHIGDCWTSTFDTTRVTQTNYKTPLTIFDDDGIHDYLPTWHTLSTTGRNGRFLKDAFLQESGFNEVNALRAPILLGFNTSNQAFKRERYFQFDFLEIDRFATNITIDVEVTVISSVRGYNQFGSGGTGTGVDTTIGTAGNGQHNGRIRAIFKHNGKTFSGGGSAITSYQAINDNTETTLTFTLTPSDDTQSNLGGQTNPTPQYPLGQEPIIGLEFVGVVTKTGQTSPINTTLGTTAGQYNGIAGADGSANGMDLQLKKVRARVNYIRIV